MKLFRKTLEVDHQENFHLRKLKLFLLSSKNAYQANKD
jgi:hypothetical protein